MVRENRNLEEVTKSTGFDHDAGTELNKELEDTGHAMYETHYPEGEKYEHNVRPIDIQGDAVPDKEG